MALDPFKIITCLFLTLLKYGILLFNMYTTTNFLTLELSTSDNTHGFSKTEKIKEITRLLETGAARAEVVNQGHTGSILSMQ